MSEEECWRTTLTEVPECSIFVCLCRAVVCVVGKLPKESVCAEILFIVGNFLNKVAPCLELVFYLSISMSKQLSEQQQLCSRLVLLERAYTGQILANVLMETISGVYHGSANDLQWQAKPFG